jgi:hypothetical protein
MIMDFDENSLEGESCDEFVLTEDQYRIKRFIDFVKQKDKMEKT